VARSPLLLCTPLRASAASARADESSSVSTRKGPVNDKPEEAFATMTWSTPAFEDLRLGFEINLYINNR
jgi:coenzyme PQQ precursor peptide PqqA